MTGWGLRCWLGSLHNTHSLDTGAKAVHNIRIQKVFSFFFTFVMADPAIIFKNKAYLWLFSGILCLVRVANTFALYYGHLFE